MLCSSNCKLELADRGGLEVHTVGWRSSLCTAAWKHRKVCILRSGRRRSEDRGANGLVNAGLT